MRDSMMVNCRASSSGSNSSIEICENGIVRSEVRRFFVMLGFGGGMEGIEK